MTNYIFIKCRPTTLICTVLFIFIANASRSQSFSLPYSNDFEFGAPGWVSDSATTSIGTRWELGSPNYGVTNSSHSGQNCWDTNLDSAYRNNANISLRSPKFLVGPNNTLKLTFWCNVKTEQSWDGMRVEYCIDTVSNIWILMDTTMMLYHNNWGVPFDGNSNGWIKSEAVLDSPTSTGQLWIRFVFTSDMSITMEGISIDDFALESLQMNPIEGFVYLDVNSNNVIDAGDTPIPNFSVSASPASPYPYRNTNQNGQFIFYGDSGVTVTLTPDIPVYSTVQPASYTVTITANGQTSTGNNFLVTYPPGITDPNVIISSAPVRPTLPHNKYIHIHNSGTAPVSGTVEFTFDPAFTFNYSNANFNFLSPNTFEFPYTNLLPSETRVITCNFTTPGTFSAGDTTIATAVIFPLSGDTNTYNNRDTLISIVVNSFDPNDKQVYPSGDITQQSVSNGINLTYNVNFQNTGTAPAINILIMDQLDPNLDLSTFEFVCSSHPITSWNIDQNRWLTVSFSNINLPDSNANEPLSHGLIRYRVKPYTNLLQGQTITNTAQIYFDNNPAVITNNTVNTVVIPTYVVSVGNDQNILVYPNPAYDYINLMFPAGNQSWEVLNTLGQPMLSGILNSESKQTTIDTQSLPNGMYFIKVYGANTSQMQHSIVIYR